MFSALLSNSDNCTGTASQPHTGSQTLHPKRDRGGFHTPTPRQNKSGSFCPCKRLSIVTRRFLIGSFYCRGLPAIIVLPAIRTLDRCHRAYWIPVKAYTLSGRYPLW